MNKKRTLILFLIAVLLLCGCSSKSSQSNSILEFFGFNSPAQHPTPTAAATELEQAAQIVRPGEEENNETKPSENINSAVKIESTPEAKSGGGLADLDWDDIDPALIELDDSELESKSSADAEDWKNDPYAWSFSESTFEESSSDLQGKQAPAPVNPPVNQPVNPIPPINPVMNLNVFVLSLNPRYCVKPSIDVGIKRIIEIINIFKSYGCSMNTLHTRYAARPA